MYLHLFYYKNVVSVNFYIQIFFICNFYKKKLKKCNKKKGNTNFFTIYISEGYIIHTLLKGGKLLKNILYDTFFKRIFVSDVGIKYMSLISSELYNLDYNVHY